MRALVRRPIGLGNYVPEGACFQAEGKKACTLFHAATRVGGDLYAVVRSLLRANASIALGLERGPVTSRPSLHFWLES